MSSEMQGRVESLQEQLAAAIAEQEVEAARVQGDEALRAEEAGRGTSSQNGEEETLQAREAELEGLLEGGGMRPGMDGVF